MNGFQWILSYFKHCPGSTAFSLTRVVICTVQHIQAQQGIENEIHTRRLCRPFPEPQVWASLDDRHSSSAGACTLLHPLHQQLLKERGGSVT